MFFLLFLAEAYGYTIVQPKAGGLGKRRFPSPEYGLEHSPDSHGDDDSMAKSAILWPFRQGLRERLRS
jgi:hypothetical protein